MRPSWLLLPFAKDAKNHLSPPPSRDLQLWCAEAWPGNFQMKMSRYWKRVHAPPPPPPPASSSSKHMRDVNQSPCPQLTMAPSPARAMLSGASAPRFRPECRVRISIKSIGSYPPSTTDGCWITARLSRTTFFDIYRSEKQNWHLLRSQPCFQVRPQAASTSYVLYSALKWLEIRNMLKGRNWGQGW